MTAVRKARSHLVYLFALLISGIFSLFGKPAPSWASEASQQHHARVFNESFRVAQTNTTADPRYIKLQTKDSNTRAVFPANQRDVFPDNPASDRAVFPAGERAVFPDNPAATREVFPDNPAASRAVFPAGERAVFPDNPGLERLVYERAVFNDSVTAQNPEIVNLDISAAIDSINAKIQNNIELTVVEKAFIHSIKINKDLVNQTKLLMVEQGK